MRRRPPTRAATRAVSGQADIGREVLRPMWPRKGARRDVCAALEPRRSARHALFAVSPTSPRGHKSIRLRPLEMNTKEGAEGELRTAPCYDRTGDGTILSAAGGPNAHFRWEVPVETISYSGSPGGGGSGLSFTVRTSATREGSDSAPKTVGTTTKVRPRPDVPPLGGVAGGCR